MLIEEPYRHPAVLSRVLSEEAFSLICTRVLSWLFYSVLSKLAFLPKLFSIGPTGVSRVFLVQLSSATAISCISYLLHSRCPLLLQVLSHGSR